MQALVINYVETQRRIDISDYQVKNIRLPWFGGFPGGSDIKESTCDAGDPRLIPGSGRSPGEGNGNPLQSSEFWILSLSSTGQFYI